MILVVTIGLLHGLLIIPVSSRFSRFSIFIGYKIILCSGNVLSHFVDSCSEQKIVETKILLAASHVYCLPVAVLSRETSGRSRNTIQKWSKFGGVSQLGKRNSANKSFDFPKKSTQKFKSLKDV